MSCGVIKLARPLIGITTYHRDLYGLFQLPGEYVDAVRRAGGIPVLLAPGEAHLDQLLEQCDGIILSGGGDVDPSLYGGTAHEKIYSTDLERDQYEIDLTRLTLECEMPVFAICRGLQVLNVALGGSLIAHIPDVVGTDVSHQMPPLYPAKHSVSINESTGLADTMQASHVTIASWHHQAIDRLADGLEVIAHASDGIIEACDLPDYPSWLMAVQWHPEMTAAEDPTQQRIFDAMIQYIQEKKHD